MCVLGACGSMELPALLQCSGTAAALLQVTLEIPLPPAGPCSRAVLGTVLPLAVQLRPCVATLWLWALGMLPAGA